MLKATIISTYMSNINKDVVSYQDQCVKRVLPGGWKFYQFLYTPKKSDASPHAAAIELALKTLVKDPVAILLDIDCIPLSDEALPLIASYAMFNNVLAGCIQRANHLNNGQHLYVGPFCMALRLDTYRSLGSPTFAHNDRADVGEEVTYAWEHARLNTGYLWPSHVEKPLWDLQFGEKFGLGTTYNNLFYHAFCIREQHTQERFIKKCQEVLNPEQYNLEHNLSQGAATV